MHHVKGSGLHMISYMLVIIGALNWLLLGLFNWEISALLGGPTALISRIVFIVIGLAAIYEVATHKSNCKQCAAKMSMPSTPSAPTPPMGGGNA